MATGLSRHILQIASFFNFLFSAFMLVDSLSDLGSPELAPVNSNNTSQWQIQRGSGVSPEHPLHPSAFKYPMKVK